MISFIYVVSIFLFLYFPWSFWHHKIILQHLFYIPSPCLSLLPLSVTMTSSLIKIQGEQVLTNDFQDLSIKNGPLKGNLPSLSTLSTSSSRNSIIVNGIHRFTVRSHRTKSTMLSNSGMCSGMSPRSAAALLFGATMFMVMVTMVMLRSLIAATK